MYIAVLTMDEIEVFETSHKRGVDEEIERRYGRKPDGQPHEWIVVYSIERVQKLVREFCSGSKEEQR